MNRSARTARQRKHATYTVAPVTRAIRAALFASTTAFALTAPVVGFAANPCTAEAALQLRCEAPAPAFDATLSTPTIDLTVVTGDIPDSVHPALNALASSTGIALLAEQTVDIDLSGVGTVIGLDLFDPATLDFDNLANISADATIDAYGSAISTGVRLNSMDTDGYNAGSISATATADGGYARARAVDAFGYAVGAEVHNAGDVHASAQAIDGTARAFGLYVFGYASSSTVTNAGDIDVGAQGRFAYATGINSVGYGQDGTVANTGNVATHADGDYSYALGVVNFATRNTGNASVTNDGTIESDATGGFTTATGIINSANRYGSATSTNTGTIDAAATGTYGASANGIANYAYTADGIVDNSGAIITTAIATNGVALSTGVYNEVKGTATFTNSGTIDVTATASGLSRATGVVAKSENFAYAVNDALGDIDVEADSVDGYALAVGLYTVGTQTTSFDNQGAITADAASINGDATAYAAVVNGGYAGIGLLINGGDLTAVASTGAAGVAYATGGFVYADVATIFNDGNASATATTVDGQATANGLGTYGGYSAISNYGTTTATAVATGDAGSASALGIDAFGYTGASMYNAADATVVATATASDVAGIGYAIGAQSLGNFMSAYATNHGSITAAASGYEATATGVVNASLYIGDAVTTNTGDIGAVAEGVYYAKAVGAYNFAYVYGSAIDNSGSIQATATSTYYEALAIGAQSVNIHGYGDSTVDNTGSISAIARAEDVLGFGTAQTWGAVALGGPYATAGITNDGTISSYAYASADFSFLYAIGAYTRSIGGTAAIVNNGDIDATSVIGTDRGYAYSYGAKVLALYANSEATLSNYGNISSKVVSHAGINGSTAVQAYGYNATITNAAGATITASAYTELFGGAGALGIDAGAKYAVNVVNDGTIIAKAHSPQGYNDPETGNHISTASAMGVYLLGGTAFTAGDASIVNNGDIFASALAEDGITFFNTGAGASGMRIMASGDASATNTSRVIATATSDLGVAGSYGIVVGGRDDSRLYNVEGGLIQATSTVGSIASDAYGGRAISLATEIFGSVDGEVHNAGTIISSAIVTPDGGANTYHSIAESFGVELRTHGTGLVANVGTIQAYASADFGYASAYGVRAPGNRMSGYTNSSTVTLDNAGNIVANADADHGSAWAVAGYVYASESDYICDAYQCESILIDGRSAIHNTGNLHATADAQGGVATAYGTVSLASLVAGTTNASHITSVATGDDARAVGSLANSFDGYALIENDGVIGASATGPLAMAIGASVIGSHAETVAPLALAEGPFAAQVSNLGDIVATATGDDATAIGIEATGRYADGVNIDNTGTIAAVANGATATATGITMTSAGTHVLTNTGDIGAFGDGTRIAIQSSSAAIANIANAGSLTGAVLTGDLDDSFDNAADGFWHAVGESHFGAGDDHLVNSGTLLMEDAAIHLGASTAGNTFDHSGTLAISGATNLIDMGGSMPFGQHGVVTFVDGMPDDVLTVVGDLAGEGTLHLDVSGLHQTADVLYVEGNVAADSTQTINVNLLDVPTGPDTAITVANVSGTATAGNFVLGDVQYQGNGFVNMAFGLQSRVEAASAEFFLGVDVTGLNDMGSVAAALAPGAQRLVDAQIGTWRQRMGVVPATPSATGLSPWIRGFTASGDVDTDQHGNFGQGGDFDFDQSSHGWEMGLDAQPTENVSVGVLFADSSANQHLKAGSGSTRLDGTTFGLYATWFSDLFYVDVSQRWSGFDARLQAVTGQHTTNVSATSFNVEAGYTGWSHADFRIIPQAQYTRTEVSDINPMDNGVSTFVSNGGRSSRGRLGVALERTFERGALTWTPYGSLNAVHEFDGEYAYAVDNALFGTTETGGTSAMVELGIGMRTGKWSLTGGVNWLDGGALEGIGGGQVTMRYNW